MLEINERVERGLIYDHLLEGGINNNDEINQVWGKEALDNAIKMWLASMEGEIIRQPNRGGYLRPLLTKPMHEINQDELEMTIRDGFDQDMNPYLQILDLQVTPDYSNQTWQLYMRVYSNDYKILTEVSEDIKARV